MKGFPEVLRTLLDLSKQIKAPFLYKFMEYHQNEGNKTKYILLFLEKSRFEYRTILYLRYILETVGLHPGYR